MILLRRFWKNFTQHKCRWSHIFTAASFLFNDIFFLDLGNTSLYLFYSKENACILLCRLLLLPVITVQCPTTPINGQLSREHERGGLLVDRRQRHVFIPTAETNSGHHSGSLQNICQPLVSKTKWGYNWTPLSISASDSTPQRTICTL